MGASSEIAVSRTRPDSSASLAPTLPILPRYAAQIGSTLTGLRRSHAADLGNVGVRDQEPVAHQSAYWGAEPVEGSVLANRLTDIVGRTVSAYDSDEQGTPLPEATPLHVTGTAATLGDNVGEQVAANLQRPVGPMRPPLNLPMDFPIDDLIVNIGLALWES